MYYSLLYYKACFIKYNFFNFSNFIYQFFYFYKTSLSYFKYYINIEIYNCTKFFFNNFLKNIYNNK